jgi:D-alanine-D-alanine ligase
MRIGVVYERKVEFPAMPTDPKDIDSELFSLAEEDELISGLKDAGHDVELLGDARSLLGRVEPWYRGRERVLLVPAILEVEEIPYVGSSPYVHELVRNKHHAKLVVSEAGVSTPRSVVVRQGRVPDFSGVAFPAIIKPLAESSSVGVTLERSVVSDPDAALARAGEIILRYDQPALVETFVRGVEIEVPIVTRPEPQALGAVAITMHGHVVSGDAFLAGDVVYDDGYGFAEPPTFVDQERLIQAAVRAASALDIRDYGRIDFRVTDDGEPWFIEAESMPHIQRHSSFFALAERRRMQYHEMLDEIISITRDRISARQRRAPGGAAV